jgi:PAS domain S-box-containing protein
MAENINQIFWMFDVSADKILYVSPAFEKVWGSAPGVLDRAALLETAHPDDRDRVREYLKKNMTEAAEVVYRIVRPDGAVRWIHDRAFPLPGEDGKPYRVTGIAEDITDHRELEEQLRQSQKMEAIGRLAGGIAHDFNNILTAILGYSHLILNDGAVLEPTREAAEAIRRSGQKAASLTAQLLAFSRKQRLEPRVLDLNFIVADMKRMLLRLIGEQIDLVTTLQPALGRVEADPNQMEHVIMNLAVNARDAMPNGGKLIIETRDVWVDQSQTERPPAIRPGFYVMLSVSDNGVGMDDATQQRIFEPFFTTKEIGKGTGLGLAMVYGTVEQSGGHILFESRPGCGATFKIYLPRTDKGPRPDETSHEFSPALYGSETILLAEDEPLVRVLARTILEQHGYRVLDATDCHEALSAAERHSGAIDLLVTDLVMPDMNGYQLAEQLAVSRPEMKVLFMSGYSEDAIDNQPAGRDRVNFVPKPFTPIVLVRKVRQVLDARSIPFAAGG